MYSLQWCIRFYCCPCLGFHFWRGYPLKYAVRNSDIPKIGIKQSLLAGNNPGPLRKAVSRNCPVCRFEHAFRGTTVLRGLERVFGVNYTTPG